MTLHFLMTSLKTLNEHKIENYVIIAESERMGKLIHRIPGSYFDIKFTRLGFKNAG